MLTESKLQGGKAQKTQREKRILMVAHGHPQLNKGGGEIAAYNLFKALDERADYKALFLARQANEGANHGGTPFSTRAENELLFQSSEFNFFRFSQTNKRFLWRNFAELIEDFQPDVVHFQHYLHIGLEALRVVKNVNPKVQLVLTLHEFLAICHNQGQMIKTNKTLCYQSSAADCNQCFQEQSPQNFLLRELYIKSFFELVDQFIAPSNFLKERYVDWGIPEHKIMMLENGQVQVDSVQNQDTEKKNIRLAYFGQLTQFKGLDVLLDAISLLKEEEQSQIDLEIHGSGLEIQPRKFQKTIKKAISKLDNIVKFHGSYEPHELPKLMNDIDWVVVPSIWWENSPLVIQEAFRSKKPVICSDIGGMAEKVRHRVDGLHFRVGKAHSLKERISEIINEPKLAESLSSNIKQPLSIRESAIQHHELYNSLLKQAEVN